MGQLFLIVLALQMALEDQHHLEVHLILSNLEYRLGPVVPILLDHLVDPVFQ